jgi:hypothetical protein
MEKCHYRRKGCVENNKIYLSTADQDGKGVAEMHMQFTWQMM